MTFRIVWKVARGIVLDYLSEAKMSPVVGFWLACCRVRQTVPIKYNQPCSTLIFRYDVYIPCALRKYSNMLKLETRYHVVTFMLV